MTRDELCHQIQATSIDVAGSVAVVAADVMLLSGGTVQQAAWLQKKLLDLNVVGHGITLQVRQIIQLNVIAKYPFNKGLQKTSLQPIAQHGAAKA